MLKKLLTKLKAKQVDPLWLSETAKDIDTASLGELSMIQVRIKAKLYDWRLCSKSREELAHLYAVCNLRFNLLLQQLTNNNTQYNLN